MVGSSSLPRPTTFKKSFNILFVNISYSYLEGTIEILCALLSNINETVFINEVENGIHYSKLYDIWKSIIEVVKEEEIQLYPKYFNLLTIH